MAISSRLAVGRSKMCVSGKIWNEPTSFSICFGVGKRYCVGSTLRFLDHGANTAPDLELGPVFLREIAACASFWI